MTTITEDLTLENFAKETGFRFRVSKLQAARIALTKLEPATRQELVGLSEEEVAHKLNVYNKRGEPLNWVEDATELVQGWNDSLELTREGAFREFMEGDGLAELRKRKHQQTEIPDSIYLESGLTLENFSDRVEALIGVRRRFRVSREQKQKISDGEMTREEALTETIKAKHE